MAGGDRFGAVPWIADTAQLIIAGSAGGLLTLFFSRSGERRALRANVREELSIVEQLRWAKADAPEAQKQAGDLAAARLRLHTAAMLAHLPREVIEEYDHLVLAAHLSSRESLEAKLVSSVPVVITECVEAAYELICDLLWHPVLTRLTHRWRFKKLQQLLAKNRENQEGANLRWAFYEA